MSENYFGADGTLTIGAENIAAWEEEIILLTDRLRVDKARLSVLQQRISVLPLLGGEVDFDKVGR